MICTFDMFTKATRSPSLKARIRAAMASDRPSETRVDAVNLSFEPARKNIIVTPADAANPEHVPTARIAYAAADSMLDGRYEALDPQDIEEYD